MDLKNKEYKRFVHKCAKCSKEIGKFTCYIRYAFPFFNRYTHLDEINNPHFSVYKDKQFTNFLSA
jgi:hypothetical protein